MTPVRIDSPDDPRLADYIGLRDPDLRRRVEGGGDHGRFIAEGIIVIRELLRSPYPVRSLLLSPARLDQLGDDLAPVTAPVYIADRAVMKAVTGFDLHRGAVASAGRRALPAPLDAIAGARRIAVLEGLNDHENLGVLFRNAAAFGIDAVLLDPTCADPLYRRSVRVSMGHVLRLPFARLDPWPGGLGLVTRAGFDVVALTPRADAEPVAALDRYQHGGRVAILLGAEGPGLSDAAIAAATSSARIPMASGVDSLNVAAAAAVAFHRVAAPAAPPLYR